MDTLTDTGINFIQLDQYPKLRPKDQSGIWQEEPDKAHWVDLDSDTDCLVVRGPQGSLCGYAGVTPKHPLFKRQAYGLELDVHGDVNYAAFCMPGEPEDGICHTVQPGRSERVWWLGFDTAHIWDLAPNQLFVEKELGFPRLTEGTIYRDFRYVIGQVTSLAGQLAALR